MPNERSKSLIESAIKALKKADYEQSLTLLDQAAAIDPKDAEIYELQGVAFAKLGRGEAAGHAFGKATTLAPNAKNFYNYALHLNEIGEKGKALEAAKRALELDPKHTNAKVLAATLATKASDLKGSKKGNKPDDNPNVGLGKKHLFRDLAEHQREWLMMGWTIVGLSILATILIKFNFPFVAPKSPDFKSSLMGYKPRNSPDAFLTIGFFATMILASMIWTSVDLIDRRGRALWMVPMMICCFLFLPFVPQSMYMVMGRKD